MEENEFPDEQMYPTVEDNKLEKWTEFLTNYMNIPHWQYWKRLNASQSSNGSWPWAVVAPEDNHHAFMARYQVSDSSTEVAFLYCLQRSQC